MKGMRVKDQDRKRESHDGTKARRKANRLTMPKMDLARHDRISSILNHQLQINNWQ